MKDEVSEKSEIKILVVDDREDNLLSIETILEEEQYKIVKASSGRSALKVLLQQQDFTLILMDVQMPDMNGFETASLIYEREKLRHIPIIFITAHNHNDEQVFQGYKVGAVDYIYKPINADLLRLKVAVFAELYRKNHELMVQEKKLKQANIRLEKEVIERRINEEKIRLLNDQLVDNNKNLSATIEELDRFAYVASHDLQEPLRKIQVFSDKILMNYESVDGDVRSALEKIVKASGRMQVLINDLLKFSRHAFTDEDYTKVDLNEIVADVLSDMELEIERSKAIIEIEKLPVIWAISSQMRQLFQNLFTNSIKFRKPTENPVIKIYLHPPSKKSNCKIVFQDNGIGFDSKYSDEIFAVFKRLHNYQDYEGTGVGLSICKKIVQKHNGKITAEGKINGGCKFFVELPGVITEITDSVKDNYVDVSTHSNAPGEIEVS